MDAERRQGAPSRVIVPQAQSASMSGTGRLDSWKEIASYLRRGVRTAQRWERDAGLPVRRVPADGGAVYAFQSDIDAWWQRRGVDHRRSEERRVGNAS